MSVEMIAALDEDLVVGLPGGGLPWDLPIDRAHFRATARGRLVAVGRRTFEEMSGWFEKLEVRAIVLSRGEPDEGGAHAHARSVEEALATAGGQPLLVIGGASVYAAFLPHADALLLTRVDTKVGNGPRFPEIDPAEWKRTWQEHHDADAGHAHSFTIERWERLPDGGELGNPC